MLRQAGQSANSVRHGHQLQLNLQLANAGVQTLLLPHQAVSQQLLSLQVTRKEKEKKGT